MMPSQTEKRRIVETAIIVGFAILFACPSLLRPDALFFPSLIKTLLVCVVAYFLNSKFLLPRFLFRNQYVGYCGCVAVVMILTLGGMMLLSAWRETTSPQEGMRIPFEWLIPLLGMFFVSTLYGYYQKERNHHDREMDLTHQSIEMEMKFLKSQINPHFLFNALNNIYALSVIKSERTPDMILKLSDMLRFTLYDSESKKVKLKREIEYIKNFIEFQKLKADTDLNIKMDSTNCNDEFMIEPMLLIPFIENSFKHGNIDNPKRGWLQVDIKTLGPILVFQVKNSLPSIAINKDVVGGIGVENVRKRLDILYPGRYEMNIETTETEFRVFMKIDTFVS
ncbi:MAG: sensor histidine kinase [Bacteroidales bacterium]|nr:sensor histidine kinase [Bacteroidales bacterium]